MESKNVPTMEQIEQRLLVWQKWLYFCHGAAFVMLVHGFIKAYENQMLTDALFAFEEQSGVASPLDFMLFTNIYYSVWRLLLWLFLQFLALAPAAIIAFHPTWRQIPIVKRLDLIGGYLLASWVALLVLGAQDPLNVSSAYNVFVIGYLLALGLGYWWLRRKKDKAEEVFP